MAINKVINKSTTSHGAMRNCIEYVLQEHKTDNSLVYMTGPAPVDITWDSVYQSFINEKRLWNKDNGRMYAHNIISFHEDEKISPAEALEFGREFAEKWFTGYQTLIAVHHDRDHIHIHLVTNTVSYTDGIKLHNTRADLQRMKDYTNDMCISKSLTIAEKGKHFDGTIIEDGEAIAWSKDKYHLLINDKKKSYVVDCAIAVMESREGCRSKDEFIDRMREHGWSTTWSDTKKNIVFVNDNGDKVRDSNLSKSFSLNINKEVLLNEFERENERIELERADELAKYYSEVESAICGRPSDKEAIRSTEADNGREGPVIIGRETGRQTGDTAALIRDVRAGISDNRTQNRAVANSENQSIADAEQRRIEAQQRLDAQKRARAAKRHSRYYEGPSH